MASSYEVRLRDWTGAIVARFHGGGRRQSRGGLQQLVYTRQLRAPGEARLYLYQNDERTSLFKKDYLVDIWRTDPMVSRTPHLDYTGFHRGFEVIQDSEGKEVFTSLGVGLNTLLPSEAILYAAGTTYTCKSGVSETVAKAYVNENIGPGAGTGRVRPYVTIQADRATGATWSGCRSYNNLYDVLLEIAELAPADFGFVNLSDPFEASLNFEFQWRAMRWGLDRSRGNGVNPEAVFSSSRGTVRNIQYNIDLRDEVNVCDVMGWGIGEERIIVTRSLAAATDTPWSRRAVTRDARDTGDPDVLALRGDEVLAESRARPHATMNAMQLPSFRYGRDWDLGDLVTFQHRDIVDQDLKVVAVNVSLDEYGTELITPYLELES